MSVYKIRHQDTLSGIAKKFGVSVSDIMKENPSIKDKHKIKAGANIFIP